MHHHRISSSSGSTAHDRQPALLPHSRCATLVSGRYRMPVVCNLPIPRSRGVAMSVVMPRIGLEPPKAHLRRPRGVLIGLLGDLLKTAIPIDIAGPPRQIFPRVPSPQASRRRPARLWLGARTGRHPEPSEIAEIHQRGSCRYSAKRIMSASHLAADFDALQRTLLAILPSG